MLSLGNKNLTSRTYPRIELAPVGRMADACADECCLSGVRNPLAVIVHFRRRMPRMVRDNTVAIVSPVVPEPAWQ